jgi:SAM-dependent methyltransferase
MDRLFAAQHSSHAGDPGTMKAYTRYYRRDRAATIETQHGARRSAMEVLPILFDLLPVRSMVDVGSGVGTWLSVARELGIEDVLGVDGPYVSPELLQIPVANFHPHDLTTPLTLPRRFDVALSLEVGEHLPAAASHVYVASLTTLAPVVLFSAAIPFQPGDHHVNCQWPEYWADLFAQHGFYPVDCIRRRVWSNPRVEYWYRQNTILFANKEALDANERLREEQVRTDVSQLSVVHPDRYLEFWNKSAPEKLLYLLKRAVRGTWTP